MPDFSSFIPKVVNSNAMEIDPHVLDDDLSTAVSAKTLLGHYMAPEGLPASSKDPAESQVHQIRGVRYLAVGQTANRERDYAHLVPTRTRRRRETPLKSGYTGRKRRTLLPTNSAGILQLGLLFPPLRGLVLLPGGVSQM